MNRPFEWQKLAEFDQFTNISLIILKRDIGKLAEFGQFLPFKRPILVLSS